MLFGQITGCDSIRDICLCLEAHGAGIYHLGIRKSVNQSNLCRANEKRDYRIYEELGMYLISVVRPLYSKTKLSEITIDNALYALDSTTISTSIVLATWALGKYSKGAVKMHTLLDLRGSIPVSIHITDGKYHDSRELKELDPEPFAFYIMDKAYVDFFSLYRFHAEGAYWVSRAKDNMQYVIISHRNDSDYSLGIKRDFTIKLTGYKSSKLYPDPIRLVIYHDAESDTDIEFITNNFEIDALEVTNLYRHRWDIEVFFKWIKQNIVVKTLWGYSENAVRTHLWVAIIAYLVIARIKADYNSPYSITEVATLIRISALERVELRDLITKPKDSTFQSQNVKDLSLFEEF